MKKKAELEVLNYQNNKDHHQSRKTRQVKFKNSFTPEMKKLSGILSPYELGWG